MLVGALNVYQEWGKKKKRVGRKFGYVVMVNEWSSLMDRLQEGLPELYEDLDQKAFC